MTSYTWIASTPSGDWSTASDWTPGGGPPGGSTSGVDDAFLGAGSASYTVTVGGPDIFDIDSLNIAGGGLGDITSLSISGALFTNSVAYSGPGGDAAITVDAGGQLLIRSDLSAANPETIVLAGGEVELGSAIFDGIDLGRSNITFTFAGSGGLFEINSSHFRVGEVASQTLTNVQAGDAIQFDDADFTGDTYTYSGTTLTVMDGSTTVLTMDNLSALPGTTFSFNGQFIDVACFAAGTRILTAQGEKNVESLRPGDMVCRLAEGGLQAEPVRWIGRRRIDLRLHPRPETVAPILIMRDAFADGTPHSDLTVSPDHAIFVDGKLVCARQLVNHTTICQQTAAASVEYFHVELISHGILLANGLAAESYLDTGNRGFFGNAGEPLVLHPDLTGGEAYPRREAASCAPFVWDAASVQPIWQRLAQRAAALDRPPPSPATTRDPQLHIVADGRRLRPLSCANGEYVFVLPPGTVAVRLESRADTPSAVRPWLEDRRRLGVYVARIVLRNALDFEEVPLDHPSLSTGWWAVEPAGGEALRRWTNGSAVLPLPALPRPVVLQIQLCGNDMTYLADAVLHRQVA
ncbi:MAG TPA: Hint domain-containing protein [Acetobacteraceae bacterium]|nr:Hint domain-containing protein [Acetobacteraceae bacterium]